LAFYTINPFRLVEHSAVENLSVINAFRGDKAELRRFKDGRNLPSVVRDIETAEEKTHISAMIDDHSTYSLSPRPFGLETAMAMWQCGYDAVLRMSPTVSKVLVDYRMPVGFKTAMDSSISTATSTLNLFPYLRFDAEFVGPASD
jgi:U3 small nucleolar RNA-associated protein 22